MHLSTTNSKRLKAPLIGGIEMEKNTKLQTAGIICIGIVKLLWYLILIAAGVLIFITMVLVEASKPNKNNNC